MRLLKNIPQFDSPHLFDALQVTTDSNDKESENKEVK